MVMNEFTPAVDVDVVALHCVTEGRPLSNYCVLHG